MNNEKEAEGKGNYAENSHLILPEVIDQITKKSPTQLRLSAHEENMYMLFQSHSTSPATFALHYPGNCCPAHLL